MEDSNPILLAQHAAAFLTYAGHYPLISKTVYFFRLAYDEVIQQPYVHEGACQVKCAGELPVLG